MNMVATPRSNQLGQLEKNQEKYLELEPPYQPLPSRPITPSSHVSIPSHHSHPSLHNSPSCLSLHPSHPSSPLHFAMSLGPQLASEIKSHPLF